MTTTLKAQIAKAKKEAPGEAKTSPPKSAYKITGFWEKGNKENSSFVARVVSVQRSAEGEDFTEKLILDFSSIFDEIKWEGKKGEGAPRGFKTYHLTDGIYKAKIVAASGAKPHWKLFAVVDGKEDPLTEAQVISIVDNQEESDGTFQE